MPLPRLAGDLARGGRGGERVNAGRVHNSMGRPSDVYEMAPGSNGYYRSAETYWLDGQVDTLSIPGVPVITYTPNAVGEVTSVSAASGQNPVTGATYNAAGQLLTLTYGSGDADSYSYYPDTGLMKQYQFSVNGQTDTGNLQWNPDGTLASLDIGDAFAAGDTQNCTFTQDDLGRIKEVNCGSEWLQNFQIDQYGDVAVSGTNDNDPLAASFSNDRISSVSGFVPNYDADGNLLDNPAAQVRNAYKWDADGRPYYVDGVSQTFDAFGRMVYNTESPAELDWSPTGEKVADMSGQSTNFAEVRLPGGAAASYNPAGIWQYDHADWLGSTRLASSPSRTFLGDLAYSPYGIGYAGSGPDGFTGDWQDTPDNLADARHRLLAPLMARWLSPDPAGLAAVNPANPQTWNAYAYVANQPLEYTDPLGLVDPAQLYAEAQGASAGLTGFGAGWDEFQVFQTTANPDVFWRDGISYTQALADGTWVYQASDEDVFPVGDPGTAGELGLPLTPVNGMAMAGMLQAILTPPTWPSSGPARVGTFSPRPVSVGGDEIGPRTTAPGSPAIIFKPYSFGQALAMCALSGGAAAMGKLSVANPPAGELSADSTISAPGGQALNPSARLGDAEAGAVGLAGSVAACVSALMTP